MKLFVIVWLHQGMFEDAEAYTDLDTATARMEMIYNNACKEIGPRLCEEEIVEEWVYDSDKPEHDSITSDSDTEAILDEVNTDLSLHAKDHGSVRLRSIYW